MDRALFLEPPRRDCGLKFIGWGAGRDFSTHFPRHNVDLAYTIDIYPENVGRRIHGVEVRGPDALRAEKPESCLVLVYSAAWFDIFRQIRSYGPYRAIRAHAGHGLSGDFSNAAGLARSHGHQQRRRSASRAIVVQGPLHEHITSTVLRCYAALHPDTAVILSTWTNEDPVELDRLRPLADSVVLSEPPANAGDHSRNFQIRSTLAGIEEAKRLGIVRVAKTRTDSLLAAPDALDRFDDALDEWAVGGDFRRFMRRRIALLADASWRYVPYHFTDQVMYGDTSDMLQYWNVEPQTAPLPALAATDSILELSRSGVVPECYIANSFLRRNEVKLLGTIEHSWETIRDGFVALDGANMGWLWWKLMSFVEDPPDRSDTGSEVLHQAHTHDTWRALFSDETWRETAGALDRNPPPVCDFFNTSVKVAPPPGRQT